MTDSGTSSPPQPLRLCSEIQLFDLCDRENCRFKNGHFCTDADMLAGFELISDEEHRAPERYISEDTEYEDDYEDQDGFDLDEESDYEDLDTEER